MPKPYSLEHPRRERVVRFVDEGEISPRGRGAFQGVGFLCRQPGEGLSCAGEPCPQAQRRTPPRQARTASGVSFASRPAEKADITMPELAAEFGRRHLREGRSRLAFTLAHPHRLSLPKKLCGPASMIGPT